MRKPSAMLVVLPLEKARWRKQAITRFDICPASGLGGVLGVFAFGAGMEVILGLFWPAQSRAIPAESKRWILLAYEDNSRSLKPQAPGNTCPDAILLTLEFQSSNALIRRGFPEGQLDAVFLKSIARCCRSVRRWRWRGRRRRGRSRRSSS